MSQVDGREYIIANGGRTLKPHEANYSPFHLEHAAIIYGLEHYDTYLRGGKTVMVRCDHKPLEKISKLHKKMLRKLHLLMGTYGDHPRTLEEIFRRLEENWLALSLKKCRFREQKIEFVGYNISREGITPLPRKLSAINSFPAPLKQKHLLGFWELSIIIEEAYHN